MFTVVRFERPSGRRDKQGRPTTPLKERSRVTRQGELREVLAQAALQLAKLERNPNDPNDPSYRTQFHVEG